MIETIAIIIVSVLIGMLLMRLFIRKSKTEAEIIRAHDLKPLVDEMAALDHKMLAAKREHLEIGDKQLVYFLTCQQASMICDYQVLVVKDEAYLECAKLFQLARGWKEFNVAKFKRWGFTLECEG